MKKVGGGAGVLGAGTKQLVQIGASETQAKQLVPDIGIGNQGAEMLIAATPANFDTSQLSASSFYGERTEAVSTGSGQKRVHRAGSQEGPPSR